MQNYANPNIKKIQLYNPPLEGRRDFKGILLDFNEKTLPPGKKVINSLKKLINSNKIQLYPEYNDLNKKIARYVKIKKDQIMITNGSDQAIELIFRTFTQKNDKVIIPSPSFAMFYQCADIQENKIIKPLYYKNGEFPLKEILKLIKKNIKLIIICNPNNPTGTATNLENIEKILKKALKTETLVYIDEAYYEFSEITASQLIDKYPNLIITRTFSKAFGLASLRIGYAISNSANIYEMMKVRGPYDINIFAAMAAKTALNDLKSLNQYVNEVMNKAKPIMEKYLQKKRIDFFPSHANFLLIKTTDSKKITKKLDEAGILVRPREGKNIEDTIRITIGTVSQMKLFIKTLNQILK